MQLEGLGAFNQIKSLLTETPLLEVAKPFLGGNSAEERLVVEELTIGKKLAAERLNTLQAVQLVLIIMVILNACLSTYLAVSLLRDLTTRLQHIMANTARLVKRETLEIPIAGSDEIAYLDQALFVTAKRLLELEKFKQELVSIVSHELRTPLLSISSTLELLSSGALGELPEKCKNRLEIAQEETNRLIRLISELLDIEKMQAGKFVLDITELQISDLVKAATAAIAPMAEAKELTLQLSLPDFALRADRDRLCQVLINLLSNSIKFSPNGATINISVTIHQTCAEFRVADQVQQRHS